MKVLIDSRGLQARRHLADGQRLCTLVSSLRRWHDVDFSDREEKLSRDHLGDYDILIIPTWPVKQHEYTAREGESIHDFVGHGNGLLLISNHAPFDTNDSQLAAMFGVEIQRTFFRNRLGNVPTVLAGSALKTEHPIIAGASSQERVQAVVTNTCSSIRCEQGNPLIYLSQDMVDQRTGEPPQPHQLFAHALDLSSQPGSGGNGRIVTIADSGFIGSRWTEVPGPGLVTWGDNLQFIRNAIRWAGGQMD